MFRNIIVLLEDNMIGTNLLKIASNLVKTSNGNLSGVYVLSLSRTMINISGIVDVECLRHKVQQVRENFESSVKTSALKKVRNNQDDDHFLPIIDIHINSYFSKEK